MTGVLCGPGPIGDRLRRECERVAAAEPERRERVLESAAARLASRSGLTAKQIEVALLEAARLPHDQVGRACRVIRRALACGFENRSRRPCYDVDARVMLTTLVESSAPKRWVEVYADDPEALRRLAAAADLRDEWREAIERLRQELPEGGVRAFLEAVGKARA